MKFYRFPAPRRLPAAALCLTTSGLLLATACTSAPVGGAASSQPAATAQPTKPPTQAQPTSAAQPAAKPTTPAASVSVDACSLLTTDEVAAAIGKPVQAVKLPTGDGGTTACDYTDPANKVSRFVSTTVTAATPSQAKGIHEATKGGGRDQVAVIGLGDDAYWDNTFGKLDVLKGGYAVGMSVTADATADRMKAAQTMASKMLARLP